MLRWSVCGGGFQMPKEIGTRSHEARRLTNEQAKTPVATSVVAALSDTAGSGNSDRSLPVDPHLVILAFVLSVRNGMQ
jgi:hypothetical protein